MNFIEAIRKTTESIRDWAKGKFIASPVSAKVGQALVVQGVDEKGVPTSWESKDFPESTVKTVNGMEPDENGNIEVQAGVQSDWNQNDPEAADYVKNRTHWVERLFEPIVWDGNTEGLESVDLGPMLTGEAGVLFYKIRDTGILYDDLIGSSIATTADGETIVDTVNSESDDYNLGFAYLAKYGTMKYHEDNVAEYFCCGLILSVLTENEFQLPVGLYCWQNGDTVGGAPHHIEISNEIVVKLPAKFIPNTFATVEQVETLITGAIGGSY